MKVLTSILLYSLTATTALILSACGPTNSDPGVDTTDSYESGIVRGHKVKDRDQLANGIVAVVAEMKDGQALCTGTLLSEDLVLTAAHCVADSPVKIAIVFNKNAHSASADMVRPADGYVQNPRWAEQTSTGRGDLALIHFRGGLVAGYGAVRLAPKNVILSKGEKVILAGYGVTNGTSQSGSGILRETESTVIGQASPTEVVTDGTKSSVCFGDSGGPAFVQAGSEYYQWGVASSVMNKTCNEASVHTSVQSYLSWIHSAGKKLREGAGPQLNR